MIGPPSGGDFGAFLGYKESRFHLVCTVEGIYVISLAKEALHKSLVSANITNDIVINKYNYPFNLRTFDWTSVLEFDNEMVKKQIEQYLVWFKTVNEFPNFGKLFNLQFVFWKDFKKNTVMEIFYKSIDKTCYPELFEDI